jgi:hypothetical protein
MMAVALIMTLLPTCIRISQWRCCRLGDSFGGCLSASRGFAGVGFGGRDTLIRAMMTEPALDNIAVMDDSPASSIGALDMQIVTGAGIRDASPLATADLGGRDRHVISQADSPSSRPSGPSAENLALSFATPRAPTGATERPSCRS